MSGPLLFRERPLRRGGLLSFFNKSFFDGSQTSLQILYSVLCCGSFALFLLECSMLRLFGSTLLLDAFPTEAGFVPSGLVSGVVAAVSPFWTEAGFVPSGLVSGAVAAVSPFWPSVSV